MIDNSYLKQLRQACNKYNLISVCKIMRSVPTTDIYGGISEDFREHTTTMCRFVKNNTQADIVTNGGSLNAHVEYSLILPVNIDIKITDLIVLVDDLNNQRNFEILNIDSAQTDGLFTNITVKERYD